MNSIERISNIISNMNKSEVYNFLLELLTESELADLSKRWRILELLSQGVTQRDIAKKLNVSLCKVTRGARIVKTKDSIVNRFLIKE